MKVPNADRAIVNVRKLRDTVVIEPDEDAFHAYVPVLPGCHTFGATVEEAQRNVAEAIALHIESMQEDGEPIPIGHTCDVAGISGG